MRRRRRQLSWDDIEFWAHEPGDCVGRENPLPLPCSEPHISEITDAYANRTRNYLGVRATKPWVNGWRAVSPASWAAGQRTACCFLGPFAAEGWITVTGSARGRTA